MTCPDCENIVERPDLPHVVRTCKGCGRELHIHEPGDHGRGMRVEKGDRFVMPSEWLTLSPNPLKSRGQFSEAGLLWMARQIYLDDILSKEDDIICELERLEDRNDHALRSSKLFDGLDIENPDDFERIVELLKSNQHSLEWWATISNVYLNIVRDATKCGDIQRAVWATCCAERCRSMAIYREHFEDVVWMGQSAKRIVDILRVWDSNSDNKDEAFWQITFTENVFALSQVFAVPLLFIEDSAYVGGMSISRRDAKLVDYLFSAESSREAVLVEIKTPATKLLGRKYRGTYGPSAELTGAANQVLDYRESLVRELGTIIEGTEYDISAAAPKCVLIAGNGAAELDSANKRRAFELYRGNLKDVEIVTYDELFRKLEVLASLFRIKRTDSAQA